MLSRSRCLLLATAGVVQVFTGIGWYLLPENTGVAAFWNHLMERAYANGMDYFFQVPVAPLSSTVPLTNAMAYWLLLTSLIIKIGDDVQMVEPGVCCVSLLCSFEFPTNLSAS